MSTAAIPMIPESAPFSSKQRAWLNGFLAGLVSTHKVPSSEVPSGVVPLSNPAPPAAPSPATPSAVSESAIDSPVTASWQDVVNDDVTRYAWHDSALEIDQRMQLAQGQPTDLRLMAAMAQLDCGQCGYQCRTYAKAIETGEETDLKKCSPGGKKTARVLVQIQNEIAAASQKNGAVVEPAAMETAEPRKRETALAYSRQNPFPAPATGVEKLTADGSAKDVRLISLSLAGSGLTYKVGDALGVFPKNSKQQVEAILRLIGADGVQPTRTPDGFSTTLRGALAEMCDVKNVSDELLQCLISKAQDKQDRKQLEKCLADEPVDGLLQQPRVIDLLARFRNIAITGQELIKNLDSLKPRLYSIASSPLVAADQVDLVVGVVKYTLDGETRHGVASTFLSNRMLGYEPVPVFIQPCHHFALPRDPATATIMVGPGTGIAPFRAFLHERRAVAAPGKNWLFFGDQHEATDFLLHDELRDLQQQQVLTRLSTAFSRDQPERIYVQDRLLEAAESVWEWISGGAHFYICGDAARMASDVDRVLHQIIATAGGMTQTAAEEYVREMVQTGRYQKDVY